MNDRPGQDVDATTTRRLLEDFGDRRISFTAVRESGRALGGAVPWVQRGAVAAGALVVCATWGVWRAGESPGRASWPVAAGILAAILLLCGVVGWVGSRALRAAAALLDLVAARAEAAATAELRLDVILGRLAEALERPGAVATPRTSPPDPLAEIRAAIGESRWELAAARVQAFVASHPDDPEGPRIAAALEAARGDAIEALRAKIAAARAVNDPDRVLGLHEALAPLLAGSARRDFDQELARWFMELIQKRLRAGKMRPDLAELVAAVAARLDATAEGASLRAALPTLRRSAGLCARCGQPYTGVADACLRCLATSPLAALATAPADPESAEPVDEEPE